MTTLKAKVETPNAMDDPTDVRFEEIPLPPPEMWNELDNSGQAADAPTPAAAPSAQAPAFAPRPVEQLEFRSEAFRKTITLAFAFDHPLLGAVEAITARRLTVAEVGEILDSRPADAPDLFDIYERMTDVPAPVLRGLIDIDGERVTGACWDFLPRLFRPAPPSPPASSSTTEAGGA